MLDEMPELQKLTNAEKLQLVEDLWNAIASSTDDLPVSEREKELLNDRFAANKASPESALTLEDFQRRLADRL